ncbi:MAG TPA: rhomboid family intramembrane serine protease [Puia sp.]|nr:rhomboid family intramembrane serine protease [Puia sp.]
MDVKENNYRKRMHLGQDGNTLIQLLVWNAVLFVILKFIYVVYQMSSNGSESFYAQVYSWFARPGSPEKLLQRPWTLITYMFTDHQLFRFISNIFWLWCFGYILQDLTGNKKIIPVYLYGGLTGAALFIISNLVFSGSHGQAGAPDFSGANCAIAALAIATTTVSPDYRIFPMINGGIPLWVLTLIFLLLNFSSIGYGQTGVYLANAGGAGAGFLFIYQMHRGHDGSVVINRFFDWLGNLFNPDKKKKTRNPRNEFHYHVGGTQPFKKIPNITQKRIDEILDKINQQGYRYLTSEEKDILKRAAEEEDL